MSTTIRVNPSTAGYLPLVVETLARHRHLAPALAPLLDGRVASLEVDTLLAEQVADVIEPFLHADDLEPPLLFAPHVGESIVIVRDALLAYQPASRRAPKIWRFTPRGTKGRVIAHEGEADRVLIESSREVAYVRPQSMTGVRYWASAPR